MDKRTFIKTTGVITAATLINPIVACSPSEKENDTENNESKAGEKAPFTLPKLAFAFDALAPHIDKMTMEVHHGKHHTGYVKKLNAAIEGNQFAEMTLEQIMEKVGEEDTAVRNNGGGHYNHSLFWKILSPEAQKPEGELAKAIDEQLGGMDKMKEDFTKAALGVFGSGWAWVIVDDSGNLKITSTPNQDNPLMTNLVETTGTPILGLDVWEHAYYLNYQNKRGSYIEAFWNVVNWKEVANNFAAIQQA